MTSIRSKTARFGLALLAGAAMLGATGAEAQTSPYREDPGTALTRHLKSLSDNPRSLHALMGAGESALELGDPRAAVTFFARAEEIAPRDGRIKAGMGSAFVQMEQAQSALKFFGDAAAMGINQADFAGDRGLAYDLVGDNKQAQRDYRLALQRNPDPEIERRLALSLAISGDKAGAIATIGSQLQRQDRAAWRTRAFVLALTGDAAGATQAVQAVMPGQAAAMQPFLARLPSLDLASRAMAVHFGHFPGDARPTQMAQATSLPAPAAAPATVAARPVSSQSALGRRVSSAVPSAPRRRPERTAAATRTPASEGVRRPMPTPALTQPAQLALAAPPPVQQPQPAAPQAAPTAFAQTQPASKPPLELFGPPAPSVSASPPPAAGAPVETAAAPASATGPIQTVALPESRIETPTFTAEPEAPAPVAAAAAPEPAAPAPAKPLAFADVIETIKALPAAETAATEPVMLASSDARPSARVSPSKAPVKTEEKPAEPAETSEPGRHWVQIASAPDSLVDSEYRRLKRKHGALLSDKDGYRAAMGKSNRVLVGPFASASEAKDFVGALKKNSLTAIAWTSADGQDIEKLPAR